MHRIGFVRDNAPSRARAATLRHRALQVAGTVALLLLLMMLVNAAAIG